MDKEEKNQTQEDFFLEHVLSGFDRSMKRRRNIIVKDNGVGVEGAPKSIPQNYFFKTAFSHFLYNHGWTYIYIRPGNWWVSSDKPGQVFKKAIICFAQLNCADSSVPSVRSSCNSSSEQNSRQIFCLSGFSRSWGRHWYVLPPSPTPKGRTSSLRRWPKISNRQRKPFENFIFSSTKAVRYL